MEEETLIKGNGSDYQIYTIKGKVTGINGRTETQVRQSGGGGFVVRGTGFFRPQTTHVSQKHHQEIFLMDVAGKGHCLHLTNYHVACMTGHELTFIVAQKQGGDKTYYVAVYNHATNSTFMDYAVLVDMFFFPWKRNYWLIGICAILALMGGWFTLTILVPAYLILNVVKANMKARKVKADFNINSFIHT